LGIITILAVIINQTWLRTSMTMRRISAAQYLNLEEQARLISERFPNRPAPADLRAEWERLFERRPIALGVGLRLAYPLPTVFTLLYMLLTLAIGTMTYLIINHALPPLVW
jgi:hypothetical protein